MAFFQMEEHSILAPVVFVDLQLELTSEKRMEWMSYPETSRRNVTLRCSRRRSPTPSASGWSGRSDGCFWVRGNSGRTFHANRIRSAELPDFAAHGTIGS